MATTVLPPAVGPYLQFHGFPQGETTCSVTAFSPASITIPEAMIVQPSLGQESNRHPIIVSLVHHKPSNSYLLFDLGCATNWKDYCPPDKLDWIQQVFEPRVEEDVDQVLAKLGVRPEQINYIVISHSHWDHTAFPFDRFPKAQVIAGPTTISHVFALSHDDKDSPPPVQVTPLELSWEEPEPSPPTHVLTFRHSHDVFSDGSVLVVATPGHTLGHVALVVRTGQREFVVLAGDCAHHPVCLSIDPRLESQYRFSAWDDEPSPSSSSSSQGDSSQGGDDGLTGRRTGTVVSNPIRSMHEDYVEAEQSLERLKALERRPEFMVVLAHDFERWNLWTKDDHGCVDLVGWKDKGFKAGS